MTKFLSLLIIIMGYLILLSLYPMIITKLLPLGIND